MQVLTEALHFVAQLERDKLAAYVEDPTLIGLCARARRDQRAAWYQLLIACEVVPRVRRPREAKVTKVCETCKLEIVAWRKTRLCPGCFRAQAKVRAEAVVQMTARDVAEAEARAAMTPWR